MLRKILVWMICYVSGLLTINFFPVLTLQAMPFFIPELVINPLRFFYGMISLIIVVMAGSTLIQSAIEQSYRWIFAKRPPKITIVLDYSILYCYYLLAIKSLWMSLVFIGLSVLYGMASSKSKRQRGIEH